MSCVTAPQTINQGDKPTKRAPSNISEYMQVHGFRHSVSTHNCFHLAAPTRRAQPHDWPGWGGRGAAGGFATWKPPSKPPSHDGKWENEGNSVLSAKTEPHTRKFGWQLPQPAKPKTAVPPLPTRPGQLHIIPFCKGHPHLLR